MLPTSHYLCRSVRGTRLHISVAALIILWARRSRTLFPRGEKGISLLQTRPGTYPTSRSVCSFDTVKETVVQSWPKILNCRAELYCVHIRVLISLFIFTTAQQSPMGHGFLIIEASRSNSDAPHSVGLLWTSDQLVAKTSTWQLTTLTTDRRPCPRRDSNPQSQQASGGRITP